MLTFACLATPGRHLRFKFKTVLMFKLERNMQRREVDGRRPRTIAGLCGRCNSRFCAGGGKDGRTKASGFPGDTGDRAGPLGGLGGVR